MLLHDQCPESFCLSLFLNASIFLPVFESKLLQYAVDFLKCWSCIPISFLQLCLSLATKWFVFLKVMVLSLSLSVCLSAFLFSPEACAAILWKTAKASPKVITMFLVLCFSARKGFIDEHLTIPYPSGCWEAEDYSYGVMQITSCWWDHSSMFLYPIYSASVSHYSGVQKLYKRTRGDGSRNIS